MIPPRNARSVPGRIGAHTCAIEADLVNRGSTTISFAFLSSIALRIHLNEAGWFSAALLPIMKITSEFLMSIQWFVIAPLPKEAARPATVAECQIRAWCSRYVTPRVLMNLERT